MITLVRNRFIPYRMSLSFLSWGLVAVMMCAISFPDASQANALTRKVPLLRADTHKGHSISDVYTPVAHAQSHTFFIQPGTNNRPVVFHIAPDGTTTNVFLDPEPDYTAFPDPHNGFSIGLDPEGYLHVAGDMHQFGSGHSRHGNFRYPERYDDKKDAAMLLWRSVKPWDISEGFEFRGRKRSPHTMPGTSFSYGRFFNDANGELYYSSRVRAFWAKRFNTPDARRGAMAVGLYRYNAEDERWRAIGGRIPHKNPDNVSAWFNVLYWADSGRPDTGLSYQGYQANFNVDVNNRMHFTASGHIGDGATVRLVYAYSDDEGETWHKADGTSIPGLPLQGDDGAERLADVVVDRRNGAINKVIADREGRPAIKVGQSGSSGWFIWNGTRWVLNSDLPGNRGFQFRDGTVILTATWGTWWVNGFDANNIEVERIGPGIATPSQLASLKYGRLIGTGMNQDRTEARVDAIFVSPIVFERR